MRSACAVMLGLQAVSVAVSCLAPRLGVGPAVLISLVTIWILLSSLKRPQVDINQIVEHRVTQRTVELKEKVEIYEKQATTDALTGLLNRRGGELSMNAQLARCKRQQSPISFVLCDIDNFKNINDKHGHSTGDLVISGVASSLRDTLRVSDIAIRWGGEEFLVCLPDTDLVGATLVAEKLRKGIEKIDLDIPSVTASFGCAELGDDSFQVALAMADMNLYIAKSKGRNQVFPNFIQKMLDRS